MNILFMTARFPYPIIGGDRLKPNHILSYLARRHRVTLVTFYHGGQIPEENLLAIKGMGIEIHVIPLATSKAVFQAGKNLLNCPLEIGFYKHPKFKKTVEQLAKDKKFDLAFAFFMRTADYIKDFPFRKILMAEDCRTLYQKRSYQQSIGLKHKLVRWWEFQRLKTYEPEIVNHFDITTLVTEEDINAMKLQNANAKYRLLTNGTDINTFVPPVDNSQRKGILFAGKLDVWANELMVNTIVNEILPKIKVDVPDAKLMIVGANPPNSLKSLTSDSVQIIPNVPDMIPYLQNAQLFLHPHTGGSGIQNKLLEAMSCGCPVVTTLTGNQGINAINNDEVLIGNTSEELAEKSIRILRDKELANRISKKSRELIVRTHSWEAVFNSLDSIIEEIFE